MARQSVSWQFERLGWKTICWTWKPPWTAKYRIAKCHKLTLDLGPFSWSWDSKWCLFTIFGQVFPFWLKICLVEISHGTISVILWTCPPNLKETSVALNWRMLQRTLDWCRKPEQKCKVGHLTATSSQWKVSMPQTCHKNVFAQQA